MEYEGKLLEKPTRFEDKGVAARLTYHEGRDTYRVEYSPLLQNGEIDGDWGVFGGSVGYTSSEYSTEKEARKFYNKLKSIPGDKILDHLGIGENTE